MLSFAEFRSALAFDQPKLELEERDGLFCARGIYLLGDGPHARGPIAEFEIAVLTDPGYPLAEPILAETGERIPRDIDRHMYQNGACCPCVWEEWLATAENTSFASFMEGPVRNFFLSQLYFEEHGEWPFGERKHGIEGLLESVSRVIGRSLDRPAAIRHLNALTGGEPRGHWECVCGSGKKIRNCDRAHLINLRDQIGVENLERLSMRLKQAIARSNAT
jgi:hypothetical protein